MVYPMKKEPFSLRKKIYFGKIIELNRRPLLSWIANMCHGLGTSMYQLWIRWGSGVWHWPRNSIILLYPNLEFQTCVSPMKMPTLGFRVQRHPQRGSQIQSDKGAHFPFRDWISGFNIPPSYPGWWFQPLWKIWKSVGMIIPNICKKKMATKPPTSYLFTTHNPPTNPWLYNSNCHRHQVSSRSCLSCLWLHIKSAKFFVGSLGSHSYSPQQTRG